MSPEGDLVGLVLAGGAARRMGGRDKAELTLGGERLIDRACRRLAPQVDRLAISGRRGYGLPWPVLPDLEGGALGPAAAIRAALAWIEAGPPCPLAALLTVPVDAPFFPEDMANRLRGDAAAFAVTDSGPQATFAFWPVAALRHVADLLERRQGIALRHLLAAAGAREVRFDDETAFANLNTPQDLAAAEARLTPPARR